MYALVALRTDGRTVNDLIYYQQNGDAAAGGEVEDPQWRRQWAGEKSAMNMGGPRLQVVQDNTGQHDAYTVDGISGATLTSTGVEKSINFWMGEQGYANFLRHLQDNPAILTSNLQPFCLPCRDATSGVVFILRAGMTSKRTRAAGHKTCCSLQLLHKLSPFDIFMIWVMWTARKNDNDNYYIVAVNGTRHVSSSLFFCCSLCSASCSAPARRRKPCPRR